MNQETEVTYSTTVDTGNAEDVLADVAKALRRHGCAMIFDPVNGMALCKIVGLDKGWAIAIVSEIKPDSFAYKPVRVGAAFERKAVVS